MTDQDKTDKKEEKQGQSTQTDKEDILSPADLATHQQLTQAIHTLDLLNSQLGTAGALLVSFYHLQRQREALAAQQAAPQYAPPGAYPPAPAAYAPPPAQPGYQPPPATYPPPVAPQPTTSPTQPTQPTNQPPQNQP